MTIDDYSTIVMSIMVGQVKLAAVLDGEPFASACGKKTHKIGPHSFIRRTRRPEQEKSSNH